MRLLPFAFLIFFPISIYLFFSRMTRCSKRNRGKQLATRNSGNLSSRRGSVMGFFLLSINFCRIFFSIFAIISQYLCDNFVISFPSSTAHFNWIPHEFSVLLASCLSIKLRTAAHVFFVNTLGVTHFNTLVRFVFP